MANGEGGRDRSWGVGVGLLLEPGRTRQSILQPPPSKGGGSPGAAASRSGPFS